VVKKPRNQPIPAPIPGHVAPSASQFPFGYNPTGAMEQRDIVSSKDGWSEYTLNDGSVIRLKSVLVDVKRAIDQYGPDGNPIYVLQTTFINNLTAPETLKKKPIR
jgi:hypothetical protein